MPCPICRADTMVVKVSQSSYSRSSVDTRVRYRKCNGGHKFKTVERIKSKPALPYDKNRSDYYD